MNLTYLAALTSQLTRRWLCLLVLVSSAFVSHSVFAAPATLVDTAQQAGQSFDHGDFQAAVTSYEGLIKAGIVNGHLYYNLGVAYYRAGKLGDAVAAFLAARRFLPRDPDAAANLKFVLGQIHDKLDASTPTPGLRRLLFWVDRFNLQEYAWATALTTGLWGVLMTLSLLWPRLQRYRLATAASLVIPVVLAGSLLAKESDPAAWGAINQAQGKVYSGPGTVNPVVFELQEGAPVLVKALAAGGYYRIELSDGKQGWIPEAQVRIFGPL